MGATRMAGVADVKITREARKRANARAEKGAAVRKAAATRKADELGEPSGGERKPATRKPTNVAVAVGSPTTAMVAERDNLIRRFYGSLPVEKWDDILSTHGEETKAGRLMALLHDPAFAGFSIERLCYEAGLDFADLVKLVSSHALGRALIESSQRVAGVIEGMAEDAASTLVTCDVCLNLRDSPDQPTYITVKHPRDEKQTLNVECPKCGGRGKLRRGGDARKLETFLKLHGGLADEGKPAVQINQQFNFGAQHAYTVSRGQQLLAEGRRAVEARQTSHKQADAPNAPNAPNVVEATVVEPS